MSTNVSVTVLHNQLVLFEELRPGSYFLDPNDTILYLKSTQTSTVSICLGCGDGSDRYVGSVSDEHCNTLVLPVKSVSITVTL